MKIYKRAIASFPLLALFFCAVSLRAQEAAPVAAPPAPAVAPAQSSEPKKDDTKKNDDKSAAEILKESTQGTGGAVLACSRIFAAQIPPMRSNRCPPRLNG